MITKAQSQKLNILLTAYLKKLGAIYNDRFNDYDLETKAGLCHIRLDSIERTPVVSIYCRFDDEKLAANKVPNYTRLNTWSGKYNFLTSGNVDDLFNEFKKEFDLLVV